MPSDAEIAADQEPTIEGQEGLGTGPVDARPYFEPRYHELEKSRIFSKSWLLVGRVEEIPPGKGFIVREIEVLKASILLVRDDAGATVRGFHNQCKHRLNKLVWEERGSGGAFVCNYHGWTYNRQGELRSMIDEAGFLGLDRKACALAPVHVDTWNGFIFVNLDPNPEQGLIEFLEEIPRLTDGYDFERLSAAVHSEIPLATNWKNLNDGNAEAYHAIWLHRAGLGSPYAKIDIPENPSNKAAAIRMWNRHRMNSVARIKTRPVNAPGAFGLMAQSTKLLPSGGSLHHTDLPPPAGCDPFDVDDWVFDIYFIWPNMLLMMARDHYHTYIFWPVDVNTSKVRITMYYPQPKSAGELFARETFLQHNRYIVSEDFRVSEETQRSLDSGVGKEMWLHDSEVLLRFFHKVYQDQIGIGIDRMEHNKEHAV
ncbi:MAG TPA: aromatic ring-hydroxylating dioxygenase subunit alpha [Allosphingosinicella sp.]|nr:aromatic ring-hydroxylating dioxygenase subunit alpha [Allosphingosinicella sp.]